MSLLREYEFNISKAWQSIFLFVASSIFLIFLLFITENNISGIFFKFKEIFVLMFIAYSGLLVLLLKRLYRTFKESPKIRITDDQIVIPTFYLGKKTINKKDIYSIEDLFLNKKLVGVNIGIRNQGNYVVDIYRFLKKEEFEQFYDSLQRFVENTIEDESREIIEKVRSKQRNNKAIFSYAVCVLSIILYFIGSDWRAEYADEINFLLIGANTKATIYSFELYRISSSTFLHISISHLLLNLMMLGVFSQFLEKTVANIRFTNLFLLSSTVAVLTSAWLSAFDASIGASGGIFGLWGAYTYLKFRHESNLPGSINPIPTYRFYFVLILEVIIEIFLLENVDYWNHLGGFVTGFIYLWVTPLGPKLETIDQPTIAEKGLFIILVASYTVGLSYFLLLYYGLT